MPQPQSQLPSRPATLARVLPVPGIAAINAGTGTETKIFGFGGLCVMAGGRCSLSSYATGLSPNMNGVCSPASHVEHHDDDGALDARLGGYMIHREAKDEPAPCPALCKGRFSAGGQTGHLFEEPVSLNAEQLIPQLCQPQPNFRLSGGFLTGPSGTSWSAEHAAQ